MIKTVKQMVLFFLPIIYLISILLICLIYFTGQEVVDYNSNEILVSVISRKENPFQRNNIKEIKVEAGGSQLLFNWRNRPIIGLADGVKRPIAIESYEVTEKGYEITFNYDIVMIFTGAKGTFSIELVIPSELDSLMTTLTIPWQLAKGFKLSDSDASELYSDHITYYIQYPDNSVIMDPIKKRASFIAFDRPSLSFSANSYGEIGTLRDFFNSDHLLSSIDKELYYSKVIDHSYDLMYNRFDSVSGLFYNDQGAAVYNEKAMLLLLAAAHEKHKINETINFMQTGFEQSIKSSSTLLTPYTGYRASDTASSSSRIASMRSAIRNGDPTIFEADDLLDFIIEQNLYSLRASLVTLAAKIGEDENSLLTAQKLYFMTRMLQEMPQKERTVAELQLTSRLLSRLISQIVWLQSNLYLYNNNTIALYAGLLAAYSFDAIEDEKLVTSSSYPPLKEIAFYLRRGSIDSFNQQGYLPSSQFWEGSIATSSDQLVALEAVAFLLWPQVLYPYTDNQRQFLQPRTNIQSLATQVKSSFLDKDRRVIQLDVVLRGPDHQYIVISNLLKVLKVVSKGSELPMDLDLKREEESWFYDAKDSTLILHLRQRDELPVRYLIYLEASPTIIRPVVNNPPKAIATSPVVMDVPLVVVDEKVSKKKKSKKKD